MERWVIEARGIVQGVGFRPFVYRLATTFGLRGTVRNCTGSVEIDVEGQAELLRKFLEKLTTASPPSAQVREVVVQKSRFIGYTDFQIVSSHSDARQSVWVSPDIATCGDCLRELFDPKDRRYRYPFLNCTNCGPRLTLVTGAPYDRSRTTMQSFTMCTACRQEYENPMDRRFHAQPNACPACGPSLELLDAQGSKIDTDEPLETFAKALLDGQIAALQGLGGFHLCCDATNDDAVQKLRQRKRREERPFAVMFRHLNDILEYCHVSRAEAELLVSSQAPIVLLDRFAQPTGQALSELVAPGFAQLGVLLAYTPIHHLLMHAVAGRPLIMTSGNRSDEPIAYRKDEALTRLAGIADLFLVHNRPIHIRCDDSVMRIIGDTVQPVRRSRGYAPAPVELPMDCHRPLLAVGGQLKGTFALACDRHAFLSHHLGDLDHFQAYTAFEKDIETYQQLFQIAPQTIVCDLHPDYASTAYARKRASETGAELLFVQHHHAHMASCMAEHKLNEPVIGVTFDGTGYGIDDNGRPSIWGGEWLVGDYRQWWRAASFWQIAMPGGDKAIREPWRLAASYLTAGRHGLEQLERRIPKDQLRTVETMLQRDFHCPKTSSVGRLFDAVAAILGFGDQVTFEGQAAIRLEQAAWQSEDRSCYPLPVKEVTPGRQQSLSASTAPTGWMPAPSLHLVDPLPLIAGVLEDLRLGVPRESIARRFHQSLVEVIARVCGRLRELFSLDAVVLSGGVFLNALLTIQVESRLSRDGFRVYRHTLVPSNDGGICLGQVAVAAAAR